MAWNESGNGKNPWDRGSRKDGPPDLDKILRDWQRKLNAMLRSGKRGGAGGGGGDGDGGSGSGDLGIPLTGVVVLLLVGWAATGFYQIDDADRGVVQRFGKYTQTTMPGLRWHLPWPIETVDKVNISVINRFTQTTSMLTADENIIIVDMVVQYRNSDAMAFLFEVDDPIGTLADASESAIREVIGKSEMDYILGEGREAIAEDTQVVIQNALDEYGSGIIISKVNLQDVNFPPQVESAVQDAIKAREDRERLRFEADSYANDVIPRARGAGARQMEDAEAYRERVTANAEGDASRFSALLTEYRKAPDVTRSRLYIETIESVYASSNKVLLDAKGSGNLLYLPLDKLMQQGGSSSLPGSAVPEPALRSPDAADASARQRDDLRARGAR